MNCPRCEQPIRTLTVTNPDGTVTVPVDLHPRMGTYRRTDVVHGLAEEVAPHPGGYVRHECSGATVV